MMHTLLIFCVIVGLCSLRSVSGSATASCSIKLPEDLLEVEDGLSKLMQKVNNENALLKGRLDKAELQLSQITTENTQLKTRLNQAEAKLRQLEQLVKKKTPQVAFSARVSGSVRYSPNQVIKFPSVIINVGNRYNAGQGQFVCGDGGLYVFTATILGGPRPTWFQIVQDGHVKADGYTGDTSKSSATHVAVVRCSPNSRVWVRRTSFNNVYNHMVWGAHSEFSGFRIAD